MRTFVPDSVESILVLRLYFVGDVLLATPVLASLRAAFPSARIDVMIKRRASDVLAENPDVDDVIVYDGVASYHSPFWLGRLATRLRRAHYDLVVDLTGDHRSSLLMAAAGPGFRVGVNHAGLGFLLDRRIPYMAEGHIVDHLLKSVESLGVIPEVRTPVLRLRQDELAESASLIAAAGIDPARPFVALSPGANWVYRRWPADRFGALASRVREEMGVPSVVLGSRADIEIAHSAAAASGGAGVSIAGDTSIRTLAGVASQAAVFVGNDSGPLHIAASLGTPVVGLFGPNTPDRYAPRGAESRVIWRRPSCSPCSQKRCRRPGEPCMLEITVDEVLDAVRSLLGSKEGM
ncbi:MAG: lipopolysaccharide heptosyltransferase II [Candidatus Eisenbacteria bacterium]|nr:lipopolysaccharide heptosyltransferase II [Candidatus Eisenbacteria bacterium]